MSVSVNSNEIEDVLASIRRLVSADLRPTERPQVVEHQRPAVPVAVHPEKLILTPALRVGASVLSVVTKAVGPPGNAAVAKPVPRLHLGAELGVTRATPEVVAALGQGVDQGIRLDWEAESGDPESEMDGLDWSSFTFARRSSDEFARRSTQETFLGRVIAAEFATQLAAKSGAAPGQQAEQPGPETGPKPSLKASSEVPEAPMALDVLSGPADWADEAEAQALADLAEPDLYGANLDDATLGHAGPRKTEHQAGPQPEMIDGSQQEEDNIFSEQVLRELVRDLIREQLQGDLGERITRNIRKMVRAEISNALAVHELD